MVIIHLYYEAQAQTLIAFMSMNLNCLVHVEVCLTLQLAQVHKLFINLYEKRSWPQTRALGSSLNFKSLASVLTL